MLEISLIQGSVIQENQTVHPRRHIFPNIDHSRMSMERAPEWPLKIPLDSILPLLRHHLYSSAEFVPQDTVYLPSTSTPESKFSGGTNSQDVVIWHGTTLNDAWVASGTNSPVRHRSPATASQYERSSASRSERGLANTPCTNCSSLTSPRPGHRPGDPLLCVACALYVQYYGVVRPLPSGQIRRRPETVVAKRMLIGRTTNARGRASDKKRTATEKSITHKTNIDGLKD